jgi:hypothetical protein
MSDLSIRRISIAEHAEMAALRSIESFEPVPNPHPEGSDDWKAWRAATNGFCFCTAPRIEESSA